MYASKCPTLMDITWIRRLETNVEEGMNTAGNACNQYSLAVLGGDDSFMRAIRIERDGAR